MLSQTHNPEIKRIMNFFESLKPKLNIEKSKHVLLLSFCISQYEKFEALNVCNINQQILKK